MFEDLADVRQRAVAALASDLEALARAAADGRPTVEERALLAAQRIDLLIDTAIVSAVERLAHHVSELRR